MIHNQKSDDVKSIYVSICTCLFVSVDRLLPCFEVRQSLLNRAAGPGAVFFKLRALDRYRSPALAAIMTPVAITSTMTSSVAETVSNVDGVEALVVDDGRGWTTGQATLEKVFKILFFKLMCIYHQHQSSDCGHVYNV